MMRLLLGVDTGGTFTDFVLYRNRQLQTHKVLSTPHAPEQAILQGLVDLQLDMLADEFDFYIVHGSTVATNAVLEGKGVSTVFITNRGLGDMLSIARQTRRQLYALQPSSPMPPVPASHCLETGGRLAADAMVVEDLTDADLQTLVLQVARLKPAAVAINLLFSYLDDGFEKAIEKALPDDIFISRSSAILPEFREYERGMTTWLNASVGPLVEGYLRRLGEGVAHAQISVMQSSGGTIAAEQAGRKAVNMLLSGPAGGLAGARFIGEQAGCGGLLTFDMGGTSTDVALIDGDLQLTIEGRIADWPVAVPMVDMHTIGAGGGSVASLDTGGLLQVGPESAGALPGPACYGQGGQRPTVTDANLLLGRLRAEAFLGGEMPLDVQAAIDACARLAKPLNISVEQLAAGIICLVDEHMAQALRVMSVQRGIDPRGLTLVSFGGAGGLHVCALAEALAMPCAIVPVHAGVLSALGMLVAPRERRLSHTRIGLLLEMDESDLRVEFEMLAEQGRAALIEEGVAEEAINCTYSLDLRYRGQSYTLNVFWQDLPTSVQAFHSQHETRYGHRLDLAVELVNIRVAVQSPANELQLEPLTVTPGEAQEVVNMAGIDLAIPVYIRQSLAVGQRLTGPLLITETVSTTYVAPDWDCEVDAVGNLMLHHRRR
ncbi:N-methylhydantoinase A [hydrothermal vent metagenome]|uniref:N-methylhydantoinase A n=1 Tax=hydrothermal vent metagenome TaxID=652676 RepID=A0A3B1B4L5_9ZZZZ